MVRQPNHFTRSQNVHQATATEKKADKQKGAGNENVQGRVNAENDGPAEAESHACHGQTSALRNKEALRWLAAEPATTGFVLITRLFVQVTTTCR